MEAHGPPLPTRRIYIVLAQEDQGCERAVSAYEHEQQLVRCADVIGMQGAGPAAGDVVATGQWLQGHQNTAAGSASC